LIFSSLLRSNVKILGRDINDIYDKKCHRRARWNINVVLGGLELWVGLLTYGFGRHLSRMHRSTTIELQLWICDDEAPSDGKQQCQTP